MTPKWLIISFIVLSLIGSIDASYLTATHYANVSVACPIGLESCDIVTQSSYAEIANVPVALLGLIYYLLILGSSVFAFWSLFKNKKEGSAIFDFVTRFTVIGFLFSFWLVYLQIFVIKTICPYCMLSALTSTTLFVLGLVALKLKNRELATEEKID